MHWKLNLKGRVCFDVSSHQNGSRGPAKGQTNSPSRLSPDVVTLHISNLRAEAHDIDARRTYNCCVTYAPILLYVGTPSPLRYKSQELTDLGSPTEAMKPGSRVGSGFYTNYRFRSSYILAFRCPVERLHNLLCLIGKLRKHQLEEIRNPTIGRFPCKASLAS